MITLYMRKFTILATITCSDGEEMDSYISGYLVDDMSYCFDNHNIIFTLHFQCWTTLIKQVFTLQLNSVGDLQFQRHVFFIY